MTKTTKVCGHANRLGPQEAELRAAEATFKALLWGDGPEALRYADAIDADWTAIETAVPHAMAALEAAGIDSAAVYDLGGCGWGHAALALAARHLTGRTPGWTQAGYDTLTGPWAAAVGPMHPADTIAQHVPPHLRPWDAPHPDYAPVDITPPALRPEHLAASVAEGWAEPIASVDDVDDFADRVADALIAYDLDAHGRPRHPGGRTGRIGRNLGKWGENTAADPIVVAGTGRDRRVLLIRRADCGQWAIPGGMVEAGESLPAALVRELHEETGLDLTLAVPQILARTLVADPRESDWAWVATTVALYRIPELLPAAAADDAVDARWAPFASLTSVEATTADGGLYEAHRPLLAAALDALLHCPAQTSTRRWGRTHLHLCTLPAEIHRYDHHDEISGHTWQTGVFLVPPHRPAWRRALRRAARRVTLWHVRLVLAAALLTIAAAIWTSAH